jgi:hypothetical protein
MTAFFVVSTVFAPGVLPNADYLAVSTVKVREMIDAGKMVKGTLPYNGRNNIEGYTNLGHPIGNLAEERPLASNIVLTYNEETKTFNGGRPEGEPAKFLRMFTSEAAANEWCQFTLQYGALTSMILTPEQVATLIELPPDEVIQQYVTQV